MRWSLRYLVGQLQYLQHLSPGNLKYLCSRHCREVNHSITIFGLVRSTIYYIVIYNNCMFLCNTATSSYTTSPTRQSCQNPNLVLAVQWNYSRCSYKNSAVSVVEFVRFFCIHLYILCSGGNTIKSYTSISYD